MNENRNHKKISVILGVVVLFIIAALILLGYFLQSKSSDQVFKSALTSLSNQLLRYVENMPDNIDFSQNDIRMNGTIQVDTDYDLQNFAVLKDYVYQYQMEVSFKNEIIKLGLAMKDDAKEVLSAKMFFQDSNGYVSVPGVLPTLLDLGKVESLQMDFDNFVMEKESYQRMIQKTKDFLIQTLDKRKFTKNNNVSREYRGETHAVTEYVYLIDEENQEQTLSKLKEQILNDSEYMQDVASLLAMSEEEFQENVENSFDSISYEEDIKIHLFTKGLANTFFGFEVFEGEELAISYFDHQNVGTITLDDLQIEISQETNQMIFSFKQNDLQFQLILDELKEEGGKCFSKFELEVSNEKNHVHVSYEGDIDYSHQVTKEDVSDAKKMEDFSVNEQGEILRNFLQKIEGTSLESLVSSLILDLV